MSQGILILQGIHIIGATLTVIHVDNTLKQRADHYFFIKLHGQKLTTHFFLLECIYFEDLANPGLHNA